MKRPKTIKPSNPPEAEDFNPLGTERAIFLQGDIDEDLLKRLTPEILRLREDCTRPITVFINSPGGCTYCADQILELMRAVNHKGERPEIITVATGAAISAAACMLSQGDYVMAFKHAKILFHGVRTGRDEITHGSAQALLQDLGERDAEKSRRLAVVVFERFLKLHDFFAVELKALRAKMVGADRKYDRIFQECPVDLPALAMFLGERLASKHFHFLENPLESMLDSKQLMSDYKSLANERKKSPFVLRKTEFAQKNYESIQKRLRMVEIVMLSKLVRAGDSDFGDRLFGGVGFFNDFASELMDFADLMEDKADDDLLDLLLKYETVFFEEKERASMHALGESMTEDEFGSDKKAQDGLDQSVEPAYRRAVPLWRFVNMMCRKLNHGENEFSALDAWHLGLIDEVIGFPLAHRERGPFESETIMEKLSIADTQKILR